MVCASSASPIKIKLITKGKHTQSGENSDMGVGSDSRMESKVTDGKKRQARFEGTEGVPDCIALLFPPLVALERAAGVKEETPSRPL